VPLSELTRAQQGSGDRENGLPVDARPEAEQEGDQGRDDGIQSNTVLGNKVHEISFRGVTSSQ
jgi:hypothetical protein